MSVVTAALACAVPAASQAPTTISDAARPPSPAEFHGRVLGTSYTQTSALYDYYRALTAASPHVVYSEYGRSIQGRALPMLLIGSERHIAELQNIQSRHRALTHRITPLSSAEFDELARDLPALVFIFIVDTDEEAGVEALQEVAWELAAAEDEATRSIRDNVVVGLFPLTNPDSHARYVTWHGIYDIPGASLDPLSIENRAHWAMNTDGNAWGVDVNRDFGWFVTPEMRAFARTVMAWRPQFFLDVHSGPNVIFMPPFPPPYHPLWPELAPKWWNAVAEQASSNFGPRGWSFFSRKDYEGVAGIGFGLSWGMLGPAVSSFLFEAFGGRPQKTTSFVRTDGTIATMRMAMDRHKLGIRSMLEVARDRRLELLRDAHDRVQSALAEARRNPVRGIVIPASGPGVDPDKVRRLMERLMLQEIDVGVVPGAVTVRAWDVVNRGTPSRMPVTAGSYVIDFVQPNARLARALLDPSIDFSDPQVEVPYSRRMPYYDAPWGNLALLFGVRALAVAGDLPAAIALDTLPARQAAPPATLPAQQPYAWVLPAGRESSYRVAVALLQEGFRVRAFTNGFRMKGDWYPSGTFTVLRSRNSEQIEDRIRQLAEAHGAHLIPVAGPFTEAGLTFGDDRRVVPLPQPRVAVLADWPVNHDHTYGGVRSVLEGDFSFGFSPVMLATLNTEDLSGYTAVVLPHAGMDVRGGPNFTSGYRQALNLENLRRYVTSGGTLIAVQGAAEVIAADEVLGRDIEVTGWARFTEATLRARWHSFEVPEEGSIAPWRDGLDRTGTHLLAAGHEREEFAAPGSFPVLMELREGGAADVVASYDADVEALLLDGFMTDTDRQLVAGRPFAVVQPAGRGRVIYFAEDPTFRGAWYGMNILFLNALLFGPTL